MGQLIKCDSASDFIQLTEFFAQTALKAQFLKFNNLEQAKQLAMTAIIRGVDMLEVCLAFDIIGGRLSKKSSAMLAEYKARGGKYKILSRTADLASIEYTYEGQTQTFSLSWDQVKQESYTLDKDGKSLKPRYATPYSRSQMMWARLISDSVRAIMPEVTGGYYTPEEMEDIVDGECTTIPMNAGSLPAPGGSAITAATTVERPTQAVQKAATAQQDIMISPEQTIELNTLFTLLKITPEQIAASMAARGLTQISELTAAQATEIIAKLKGSLPSIAGQSSVQMTGPITQELVDSIQNAVKLCAQVGGGAAINEAIFAHLQKHGLLIHQLTLSEGELLLAAIEQRQTSLFLEVALNGHIAGGGTDQGNG
jgi:hypothetical protein